MYCILEMWNTGPARIEAGKSDGMEVLTLHFPMVTNSLTHTASRPAHTHSLMSTSYFVLYRDTNLANNTTSKV